MKTQRGTYGDDVFFATHLPHSATFRNHIYHIYHSHLRNARTGSPRVTVPVTSAASRRCSALHPAPPRRNRRNRSRRRSGGWSAPGPGRDRAARHLRSGKPECGPSERTFCAKLEKHCVLVFQTLQAMEIVTFISPIDDTIVRSGYGNIYNVTFTGHRECGCGMSLEQTWCLQKIMPPRRCQLTVRRCHKHVVTL